MKNLHRLSVQQGDRTSPVQCGLFGTSSHR
jgi:hypothetical protein